MRFGFRQWAVIIALASGFARGSEFRVPEQFSSIQAAVNAASPGDTVLVGPGVYFENVEVSKRIRLHSLAGREQTVIDGRYLGAAVRFALGEQFNDPPPATNRAELHGFTIRHGLPGVLLNYSSLNLSACNVVSNRGNGAIEMVWSDSLIVSNNISFNETTGIDVTAGRSSRILHNTIATNSSWRAGGIGMNGGQELHIGHNRILGNRSSSAAGGIDMFNQSDIYIYNNVISRNSGTVAGIAWSIPSGTRGPRVVHNTISWNDGAAVRADGYDQAAYLGNNIIDGLLYSGDSNDRNQPIVENNLILMTGGLFTNLDGVSGNMISSPTYVDRNTLDFRLAFRSRGIDAAAVDPAITTDIAGIARPLDGNNDGTARPDMGAYEYVPAAPAPPTALLLTSEPSGIQVNWNNTSDAESYIVYRGNAFEGPFLAVHRTTNTQFFETNLVRDQRYFYTVAAVNPFGEGAKSAIFSERAGNLPPITVPDTIHGVEDTFVEIRPLLNDSDPNGDSLQLLSVWRTPEELYSVQDGERVLYPPPIDFSGSIKLFYAATDGRGIHSIGEITVVIAPVNDPPFAYPDVSQAEIGSSVVIQLRATDPDSEMLQFELVEPPIVGRIQSWEAGTGRVVYRTGRSLSTGDSFRFIARDGLTNSNPVFVSILRVAPTDLDRDAMPDSWERLMDINNPDTDPDRDGAINLFEYLANTDARDPSSVLRLTSVSGADGSVSLRWNAVGQMRYRIQRSLALGSPFVDVVRPAAEEIFPASDGAAGIAEYRAPLAGLSGFYRLLVLP